MKGKWWIAGAIIMMAAGGAAAATKAGGLNYCGDLKNAYGPFDYRSRSEHVENFNLVEGAHFTPEVENGIRGSSGQIGGDLDYTLRAIPNHHRALAAMARLAVRAKAVALPGAHYPVECYFERAMRFRPDDGAVHAEFGNYMHALGKQDKAFAAFKKAAAMAPENAAINYNLGLAYFEKKNFAEALNYAKRAYALGFPLPGLKNKLVAVGKWNDQPE
jgi:tetratricopeptide (TPR) repeat protein